MGERATRSREFVPAAVAAYGVLLGVAGAIARTLGTAGAPALDAHLTVGLTLAAFVGLWFVASQVGLVQLGLTPLGGLLGLLLAGWGLSVPSTRAPALEAAGGAALLAGLLGWLRLRSLTSFGASARSRDSKSVRLVRAGGRALRVSARDIGPGDRFRVEVGESIPSDGVVVQGAATVDGAELGWPSRPVQTGERVWAGTVPDARLDVLAESSPRSAYRTKRGAALHETQRRVWAPERSSLLVAGAVAFLALTGIVGVLILGSEVSYPRAAAVASALALASPTGLPSFWSGLRAALALRRLAGAGLVAISPGRLRRLLAATSWRVDPQLLAGRGRVRVAPVRTLSEDETLALAASLMSDTGDPDRTALEAALSERGLRSPVLGARGVRGEVMMGTAQGVRWQLGPPAALKSVRLPPTLQHQLRAWSREGQKTLILAGAGHGAAGVLAVDVEPSPDVAEVARRLGAELADGFDEPRRARLGQKADVVLAKRGGGRSTALLLPDQAVPPETGMPVFVVSAGPHVDGDPSRTVLVREGLAGFPEAWSAARHRWCSGRHRAAVAALGSAAAGAALAGTEVLVPIIGGLLGLAAVVWTTAPAFPDLFELRPRGSSAEAGKKVGAEL